MIGATDVPGFYNCLGVESPGLSSAPAIGKDLAIWVAGYLGLEEKNTFISERKGIPHFARLTDEQRNELIQKEVTKNGGKSYLLIDRIKEDEKND